MKSKLLILVVLQLLSCGGTTSQVKQNDKAMNKLTPQEKFVIEQKGTEQPFSGEYYDFKGEGTYICRRCNAPLYRSEDKFDSHCGWPSFDDQIEGAVTRSLDADGRRTEITCTACGAHLGHIFQGEGFTDKDTRHCVNSISMKFTPKPKLERAIFAGGCFWGVEHLMQQQDGVASVVSGYIGGEVENPTYEQVKAHTTGHAEAVEVLYDPSKVDYETLAKLFFEIHDPTQRDGQGPDIGDQYRSEIFYTSSEQKQVAQALIKTLRIKGYDVATKLTQATTFYPAEDYHQDYYQLKGTEPYCHFRVKRF
ncbi:MAG: bifunctional methionine sulfoxide reductase B/A protein [Rikenellaceae bacterium]